jgi:hypothetical protein
VGSVAKGKTILKPDIRLLDACIKLRHHVEHQGKDASDQIFTVKVDGVVIGYKVVESSPLIIDPYFTRYCLIKTPGYKQTELKARELAAIKTAVLEAFFEPQQGPISVKVINEETIEFSQVFMIAMIQRGAQRFSNKDMLEKGLVIGNA